MCTVYFRRYAFLHFICILLKYILWLAILFLGGEFAILLLCIDTWSGHFFTESEWAWFLIWTLLVNKTVTCHVSVCELAWLLICTLLVTKTVTWLVSGGELAWLFMYSLLVTQSLVSASELARSLICTLLVTQTVACLVSGGKLACFFLCKIF